VDGTSQHLAGPCEQWLDPLLHDKISVRPAVNLDAHEAIVIYRETEREVQHCILRGPAVYIPQPNEWLHQFRWHGNNGHGQKVPRALEFEKLRVIPDQMYFDVEGVRTSDEALIIVRLMVFFELTDIEQMLAQTHDPIADFINALGADIIRFAGACDFESFKTKAAQLNQLSTYLELVRGAERIGYRVNKVVYRGYLAPGKLQAMHDNAIETRTGLVLEAETEERRQEIIDFQQTHDHERATRDRKEEQRALDHQIKQTAQARDDDLTAQREKEELDLLLLAKRHATEEAHRHKLLELRAEEWQRLQESGADLTAVLVAQERNPDKLIRLEQKTPNGSGLHFHEAI
jgi:regulator of protease activity HflC (stomatin/prohibitin superfamily)